MSVAQRRAASAESERDHLEAEVSRLHKKLEEKVRKAFLSIMSQHHVKRASYRHRITYECILKVKAEVLNRINSADAELQKAFLLQGCVAPAAELGMFLMIKKPPRSIANSIFRLTITLQKARSLTRP